MRRLLLAAVLVLTAGTAAWAETKCVVTGTQVTIQEVVVTPAGAPAITLSLREVPMTTELPTRCGAPLVLHVGGAVALTAKRGDIWLHLAKDVTSRDGSFVAMHGAQVIDACVQGDRVIATAVLFADDVLEGEHKRPSRFVRNVEIPCDALTLDAVPNDKDEFLSPSSTDGTDKMWEVRRDQPLVLRTKPSAAATGLVLEYPNCSGGCINVRQIRAKKGWLYVEDASEGVRVRGWVPIAKLKPIPDTMLVGNSYGCTGNHGGGAWGEGPIPGAVERTGIVRASTLIYAEPGNGVWGRFLAPTKIKVRITKGSPWAELREVPGLDGDPIGSPFLSGMVAVDTLTLDPLPPTGQGSATP